MQTKIQLNENSQESLIEFKVDNQLIRGAVTEPLNGSDKAIVFLHGWSGNRSGPHDLLRHLSRNLADSYICLRFDFRGRGDSDGKYTDTSLASMSDDCIEAVNYLKATYKLKKICLVGLCSGGNVAIGSLDRLDSIDSLFLLSVYPFGEDDNFNRSINRSGFYIALYFKKLFLKSTWKKIFKGKVNYKAILKIIFKPFFKSDKNEKTKDSDGDKQPKNKQLKKLKANKVRTMFIYGTADPEYKSSHHYYQSFCEQEQLNCTFDLIEGANHNFYSDEWTKDISDKLKQFLNA